MPLTYPQTYLNLARERGADPQAIIQEVGLPDDVLTGYQGEISFLQMKHLVDVVVKQTGDDGIGIEVGWRLPPTAFGNLGYALLCSETMGDVVELCIRFWHLLGRALHASFHAENTIHTIDLTPIAPLPEPINHLIFESTMASFYRGFQVLTGALQEDIEIWFSTPPPRYENRVIERLGRVSYNMPVNQFRFSAHLMQTKLSMYNPTGLKFAIQQCEREESLLDNPNQRIRERVQSGIVFGKHGYPTLQDISEQLNMTARTLRRRLEEEGTNYKIMLEEAKRRDAIQLLADGKMEVQRVASLLGYQDPANFTRAFRQWTGQTPSEYRMTRNASH